jgi:hypothetical protein
VPDGQAQIRDLLADMAAGYRAKDAGQIAASCTPDIVMDSLAPTLRSRRGDLLDIGGGRKVDLTTAGGVQRWLDGFVRGAWQVNDEADLGWMLAGCARRPGGTSPARTGSRTPQRNNRPEPASAAGTGRTPGFDLYAQAASQDTRWRLEEWDSSHVPYITGPHQLAPMLLELAAIR